MLQEAPRLIGRGSALERPPLFLGQIDKCLLIGDTGGYRRRGQHGPVLTTDHLVPAMAFKKNKILFGNIINRQENQVRLCDGCHQKRDHHPTFGKMTIYRQFGIPGLMQDLASYPRATDPDLYVIQFHQWRALFGMVQDNLQDLLNNNKIPKIPASKQPGYRSALDAVNYHLGQWNAQNFDVKYPALELLLQP